MRHVVISFLGTDSPGIVDNLAGIIKQHDGNWQTSSMRHLSGYFAGILEVLVSEKNAESLVNDLQHIAGLNVQIEVAIPDKQSAKIIRLDLTANDRQGIVGEISAVIDKAGGNLVKLASSQVSAAHSGQSIFKATANIAISGEDNIDNLVSALEDLADDLIVDVILST